MKLPPIYAALICAGLMAAPGHVLAQAPSPAAASPKGPRLTFATNEYHFGRASAGTLVKYVYLLTNTGDQTLEIYRVTPGCHCTTAGNWSHKIEPGQSGQIPIQFDTGNFHGNVSRTITVNSNDKLAPNQTLKLDGTIWKALECTPQFAFINLVPNAPSNTMSVVLITDQLEQPITLSNPTSANAAFTAELKTIKPGKEYQLMVTAVPPLPAGSTTGTISLKTSYTNMPVLNITAIAMTPRAVPPKAVSQNRPPAQTLGHP